MEDIKTLIRGVIAEIYAGQDNDTVIDQLENVLSKLTIHPHPSDSDIEDEVYEKNKDDKWADTSEKKSYRHGYMSGVIEGKIAMRDRMNREIAEYKELVFRLAEWSKKYPRGKIYGASRQEGMDGELIEMEEAAKTILQKFRNRDL